MSASASAIALNLHSHSFMSAICTREFKMHSRVQNAHASSKCTREFNCTRECNLHSRVQFALFLRKLHSFFILIALVSAVLHSRVQLALASSFALVSAIALASAVELMNAVELMSVNELASASCTHECNNNV